MPSIVCTAYAIASASTTPRPIAIFFCLAAFSLAVSAAFLRATSCSFLADYGVTSADALGAVVVVAPVVVAVVSVDAGVVTGRAAAAAESPKV